MFVNFHSCVEFSQLDNGICTNHNVDAMDKISFVCTPDKLNKLHLRYHHTWASPEMHYTRKNCDFSWDNDYKPVEVEVSQHYSAKATTLIHVAQCWF